MEKSNIKYQISKIIPGIFVFWFFISGLAYAETISSTELINEAKEYDGKKVSYAGEVIGDVMVRGEYAWINVNDGSNAVGIWAGKDLIKDITHTGSYKAKGDLIKVEGVFNRSCRQHGGDLDIHAENIVKIKQGHKIYESLDMEKLRLAFGLAILAALIFTAKLYIYLRYKRIRI